MTACYIILITEAAKVLTAIVVTAIAAAAIAATIFLSFIINSSILLQDIFPLRKRLAFDLCFLLYHFLFSITITFFHNVYMIFLVKTYKKQTPRKTGAPA